MIRRTIDRVRDAIAQHPFAAVAAAAAIGALAGAWAAWG